MLSDLSHNCLPAITKAMLEHSLVLLLRGTGNTDNMEYWDMFGESYTKMFSTLRCDVMGFTHLQRWRSLH